MSSSMGAKVRMRSAGEALPMKLCQFGAMKVDSEFSRPPRALSTGSRFASYLMLYPFCSHLFRDVFLTLDAQHWYHSSASVLLQLLLLHWLLHWLHSLSRWRHITIPLIAWLVDIYNRDLVYSYLFIPMPIFPIMPFQWHRESRALAQDYKTSTDTLIAPIVSDWLRLVWLRLVLWWPWVRSEWIGSHDILVLITGFVISVIVSILLNVGIRLLSSNRSDVCERYWVCHWTQNQIQCQSSDG